MLTCGRYKDAAAMLGRVAKDNGKTLPRGKLSTKDTEVACVFVWLVGFLTSSPTTRLYRGRVPRLTTDNFTCCHTRDRAGRP